MFKELKNSIFVIFSRFVHSISTIQLYLSGLSINFDNSSLYGFCPTPYPTAIFKITYYDQYHKLLESKKSERTFYLRNLSFYKDIETKICT